MPLGIEKKGGEGINTQNRPLCCCRTIPCVTIPCVILPYVIHYPMLG